MKSRPRSTRSPSNSPTTVAFSVAPCRMPKIVLRPSSPMPNAATICCPSNGVASISNAHSRTLSSRRSIMSFNFARLASMKCSLTALFSSPYASELAHRLAVLPCAQPEHQLLPHGLGQRLAAVEHFVAGQPHFLVLGGPHAWPLDRNLLAHHHAVAALTTPPAGRPVRLPLAARAGQCPDFFLHQQIHQLQAGLTNQFTHAFTQPAHHLGHGQHHLHRRISIRGHC